MNYIKLIKDKRFWLKVLKSYNVITIILSLIFPFVTLPEVNNIYKIIYYSILILLFINTICKSANLKEANFVINKTKVSIREGNILDNKNSELNVIGFNEYFDTIVDDKIISKSSLNGKVLELLKNEGKDVIQKIDNSINDDDYLKTVVIRNNDSRRQGKKIIYELGSCFEFKNYIFTALTKFDEYNKGYCFKNDYLRFCLIFWENIDRLYNGRTINIPILGAGITRFGNNKPSKQELLKLLLWTFKISGLSFTVTGVKINFLIYKDDMQELDFFDLQNSLTCEEVII